MRRILLCLCACLGLATTCLGLATTSLAAEPFARATIDNDGPIVPGQQVHVTVDVFVPDFFTAAPDLPWFDVPDATVTIPDERARNVVQTVNGVQYSGISRSYIVLPERTGAFRLPPLNIGVTYSQEGKPVSRQVSLASTSFTVVALPGNTQTPNLHFTAREVTISQSFDRDTSNLRVGDALVRTITVFAKDTQAMMIPAIVSPQADGLKIYARNPTLEDNVQSRDRSSGSIRVETITYIAEKSGRLQIPGISYPWYDLDAHASAMASLDAISITVSATAPSTAAIPPVIAQPDETGKSPVPMRAWLAILCALVALLPGLRAVRHHLPTLRNRLHDMQQTSRNSEPRVFRQLMATVRKGNPKDIYQSLDVWTRRAGFPSIGKWLSATSDENVTREVGKLESALFSAVPSGGGIDRDQLQAALETARARRSSSVRRAPGAFLPRLNPTGRAD